jgi:hypothetical protein
MDDSHRLTACCRNAKPRVNAKLYPLTGLENLCLHGKDRFRDMFVHRYGLFTLKYALLVPFEALIARFAYMFRRQSYLFGCESALQKRRTEMFGSKQR